MNRKSWVVWALVGAIALAPRLAAAQCGMGGGSGHDHGTQSTAAKAKSTDKNDQKTRQAIDRVLADDRSRMLLMDALFADDTFMQELIDRLASAPEWRAMVVERLEASAADPAAPPPPSQARKASRPEAALYACPMHPEVTARRPGACPKCGMALERKTS